MICMHKNLNENAQAERSSLPLFVLLLVAEMSEDETCDAYGANTSTSSCSIAGLNIPTDHRDNSTLEGRIVIRGIAVRSLDGFTISDGAHLSVIPTSVAGGAGRSSALKSSFVLDCVYELAPPDSHDDRRQRAGDQALAEPTSTMANGTASARRSPSQPSRSGGSVDSEQRSAVPRVVKWFRNREAAPFYQWVPAARSRLFHHVYRDLLDPMYKHSDKPEEMFRAVRITRPVKELSGNFSCHVEDDYLNETDIDDVEEQIATHELLIYDPPTEFELHLDLASRQLRCEAWSTEHPTTVEVKLFRQDYDVWQMPLAPRVDLNSTSGFLTSPSPPTDETPVLGSPLTTTSSPEPAQKSGVRTTSADDRQLFRVGAFARLSPEDVRRLEVDTSRTFVCEIFYDRLRPRSTDEVKATQVQPPSGYGVVHPGRGHVFQRSVRIVNGKSSVCVNKVAEALCAATVYFEYESPSSEADYEEPGEVAAPRGPLWYAWSAALTSGVETSQTQPGCPTTVPVILVALYIHARCI
ncbi:hypothetical protein BIW11_14184 [Tropilaelaps mercedesae]|uniref:Ig-like domain-containing protein n=1 Tax=Tropilaelaps mercedesae TaxID=418985 RepID=A0A1V9WYR2_9ACAR|nr:hypothetical protein BIW11_14184 [Tropilaelaps mercedesae]